jgi:membrane-associated phospholipid phosphatase
MSRGAACALLALAAGAGTGCTAAADAARAAARDPAVWAPLAGAAVFALGDLDEEVADWAREEPPLFGSNESAGNASDSIRELLRVEALTLEAVHLWRARDRGAVAWLGPPAAALGSALAVDALVNELKDATDRERPDGSDDRSFPSSHAGGAAVAAIAADEVLRRDFAGAPWLAPVRWTNAGLVALGAWSRVEAGAHHPSDVLAGAALGAFLGRFAHALLHDDAPGALELHAAPDEIALIWSFRFGGAR